MNSKKKAAKKRNNNNNNSEDEQIKTIIKEINFDYRHALFFDIRAPNKLRTLVRKRTNFSTINIKPNIKRIFQKEDSLSFKLQKKINKEALIMELRQELKYHIKFNSIYKNLLSKIIKLKEQVKANKEQVEFNTNALKESFKDRFAIIDNYEKAIQLLNTEKNELINSSAEILKLKGNNKRQLQSQYSDIQEKNDVQRIKIKELQGNINALESKRDHVNEELENQLNFEEMKYEKYLKLYEILKQKYEYYLEEYNSYIKSGAEIAKVDVKLYDDTHAKNSLIEEDLDIKLNEQLIKKDNLVDRIKVLKSKLKILEEKQKEEKEREAKRNRYGKVMGLYKHKLKFNNNFRKSASSKNYNKKLIFG